MACTTNAEQERTAVTGAVASAVTAVTLTVAFGLLAVGWPYFWIAFPLGFGAGMPLAVGLARRDESRAKNPTARRSGHEDADTDANTDADTDAAIDALRNRYARGEIGDREFEARVERLLETGVWAERDSDDHRPADRRAKTVRGRN